MAFYETLVRSHALKPRWSYINENPFYKHFGNRYFTEGLKFLILGYIQHPTKYHIGKMVPTEKPLTMPYPWKNFKTLEIDLHQFPDRESCHLKFADNSACKFVEYYTLHKDKNHHLRKREKKKR